MVQLPLHGREQLLQQQRQFPAAVHAEAAQSLFQLVGFAIQNPPIAQRTAEICGKLIDYRMVGDQLSSDCNGLLI